MAILDQHQRLICEFFRAIEPAHKDNKNLTFSYIAVKREDKFYLIQGALLYHAGPSKIPTTHYTSENVRSGNYHLSDMNLTGQEAVDCLLSGCIQTPDGELFFPGNETGTYGAAYDPLHPEGLKIQARFHILTIYGATRQVDRHPLALDWELRAAPMPFESLQELAFEYKIGLLRNTVSVEVIAFHVAAVDYSSIVRGTSARLGIFLMHGASIDNVALGYRIFSQGRVTVRSLVNGPSMEWMQKADHQYGSIEIDVPSAAVIQCFVSYLGVSQHFGWVSDPSTVQNPKRAVYSVFDSGLSILTDFLTKSGGKGRDARDLESGIAWLLWMLGFSVAHLGGTDKTQDAADLIATTPRGDFAIIECTTGLLRSDNKLPLLIDRTERVRRGIIASNNKHLRVLPIIVTSRTRPEIVADVEQAEKLGVLVITRENLEQAVANRTLLLPNAEQIYDEGVEAVDSARAKFAAQTILPLERA